MNGEGLNEKVAVKKEEKVGVAEPKVTTIVSDKDAAVANIIASQGTQFPSVKVIEEKQNIWALPPECKEFEAKYSFKWVSKDPRMLDRSVIKGWKLCTKILCSWMKDLRFAAHGGIERYGHILAFRPVEISAAFRLKYQKKSNDAIKVATKEDIKDKKGSEFYTAKISSKGDGSDDNPQGLVQDRDF